jgi:plastocyanin
VTQGISHAAHPGSRHAHVCNLRVKVGERSRFADTRDVRYHGLRFITTVFTASVVVAVSFSVHPAGAEPSPRGPTPPEGTHVEVLDFRFDEPDVSIGRGETVIFDFVGPSHHTATDGTGMDLYDSGSVGAGEPSTWFTFEAAGTYRFVCTPHLDMGMVGWISVPMRVAPETAGPHHSFTAAWATESAPAGSVYDVQIRRPGKPWKDWRTDVTTRQGTYIPSAGEGNYRFRARLRRLAGGVARWSTVATIRVR